MYSLLHIHCGWMHLQDEGRHKGDIAAESICHSLIHSLCTARLSTYLPVYPRATSVCIHLRVHLYNHNEGLRSHSSKVGSRSQ